MNRSIIFLHDWSIFNAQGAYSLEGKAMAGVLLIGFVMFVAYIFWAAKKSND